MNREYDDDDSDDDKTGTKKKKKLVAPHGHYTFLHVQISKDG